MEPAVLVNSRCRFFRLLVVTWCNGLTTQEDFIIFTKLTFESIHKATHTALREGFANHVARNCSRRFRESVTHKHVQTSRMHEGFYFRGNSRTRRGEEVGIFQAQCLAEQVNDGVVVELVAQAEQPGDGQAL